MTRIVICDADRQVCRFLQTVLQGHQFEVELVHTAQACLATCQQHAPELLVSDLCLPDMPGIELVRQLRLEQPALPIIAISGEGDDALQAAWENGADWVMRKPLAITSLVQTARHLIARHTVAT